MNSFVFRFAMFAALALASLAPAYAVMPDKPGLRVTTLTGDTFDLAAQRGHWVIVNYWATWCVPCIKEMPDISRFVATHENVRAIGLAYQDGAEADIKAFLARHPVAYPVAQVTLDRPLKNFDEPMGLPTTYLIDPAGKVVQHRVGPVTAGLLKQWIGAH
ncbi:MAG: TlpA disulfide reductase family protein [Rhodanobacter sp.]